MVFSPWKAFFPSRRAWILLDSSHIHQPICWRSGNRWDTPQGGPEDFALGAPEPMPQVEPPMAAAFQDVLAELRKAGVSIRPVAISEMLDKLNGATSTVQEYEGARFLEQRFKEYGSRLGELVDLIQKGLQISVERYDEARRYIAKCKTRMAEMYTTTPVILVPAATGPAPLGLASTGDPKMNAP